MARPTPVIGWPCIRKCNTGKEFNVVSSTQFRRQEATFSLPRDEPCGADFSVVLLHIKDRNAREQTFCIYIPHGTFLCQYAQLRVNLTPTGEGVLCLRDEGLFLQLG